MIRIVYFMAVSLTAGVFVAERQQGLLDRSLVAGKTKTHIKIIIQNNMKSI